MIDLKRVHEISTEAWKVAKEFGQPNDGADYWARCMESVDRLVSRYSDHERILAKRLALSYLGYWEDKWRHNGIHE